MKNLLYNILPLILLLICLFSKEKELQEVRKQNVQILSRNEHRFIGYVIDKVEENNKFYLVVVGYGKIEVSKVEYYEVIQGKPCPEFIKERGPIHG